MDDKRERMVRVWEVRYPDVRRGSRGEPPFSTALFRSYSNAEMFKGRHRGSTISPMDITYEQFRMMEGNHFFERMNHHG